MKIIVGYASAHGSTAEIAARVAQRLRDSSAATVDCRPMVAIDDVAGYDAAVLGSPIHDQAWLVEATDFLTHFGQDLDRVPVWLFSVGMPGALPRRVQGWAMQEEGQMATKLSSLVHARGHRLFSGVILAAHLTARGRAKFRLMGGRYGDFRDWQEIDAWADSVAEDIHQSAHRSSA